MSAAPVEVPAEYRSSVSAVLDREPQHLVSGEVAEPGPVEEQFSLLRFLYPYRVRLCTAFLLLLSSTAVDNAGPIVFAKAIDWGIAAANVGVLLRLSTIYLAMVLARMLLRYLSVRYIGRMGQDLLYRLRNRVFAHLQSLSYEYHSGAKPGHTLAVLTADINTLSTLFQDGLINFVVQGLVLFVVAGVLLYMNCALALILLCAVLPPAVLVTVWFSRRSAVKFRAARTASGDVIADVRQTLYGLKQIRLFNRAGVNGRQHAHLVDSYRRASEASAKLSSLYAGLADFIEIAAQTVVLCFGLHLVIRARLSVGELVAFSLFLRRFFGPLTQITLLFGDYQSGRAAIEKIRRFLSVRPAVPDGGRGSLRCERGHIRLRGVCFAYEEGKPALQDIDLNVPGGATVAIVGATGSGKSTLIKLITRLLEPTAGSITIDGQDIRGVSLASLRSNIGVVQQDAFLFHGSLRENIAFAHPEASSSRVEAACRAAGLGDLVARLPRGLDTSVHEQGVSLSAGERQLLALSRLFLTDPRIILMDEATSNLDSHTESRVLQALRNLAADRTTLLVSHRLGSIGHADVIVVLQGGTVHELGTHAELLARQGVYAAMVEVWQKGAGPLSALPSLTG